jgi:hypothetical protein
MKLQFSRQIFQKRLKYQVSSPSVQWQPSCFMQTDRQDMAKLTVPFRNFANAPKNNTCSKGGTQYERRSTTWFGTDWKSYVPQRSVGLIFQNLGPLNHCPESETSTGDPHIFHAMKRYRRTARNHASPVSISTVIPNQSLFETRLMGGERRMDGGQVRAALYERCSCHRNEKSKWGWTLTS